MTMQEKCINAIVELLSPCQKHNFRDGDEYNLRTNFVKMHKRMNLKVERNVLPFTRRKAVSLTSSPVNEF